MEHFGELHPNLCILPHWTIASIVAARALSTDDVCFVGIGAPSAACNVARLTHAPGITLIYENGIVPNVLPLSIGDGELCETAVTTTSDSASRQRADASDHRSCPVTAGS